MTESPSTVMFTRRTGAAVMVAAALVLVLTGCSDQPPATVKLYDRDGNRRW